MELERILAKIERSRDDMVRVMSEMIRIPAIAPENGGTGEGKRADMLTKYLEGYDSVIRIDAQDDFDPNVMRPNILAKKNGKGKGTVWIIAHTDTVPVGDFNDWETDPFDPVVKDGKIYGRGTEDNGQAVISSLFASKFIPKEMLSKRSIGIAYVADEEMSSKMGIDYLIKKGCFSKDDVFIVPDWGSPDGDLVDVAEKNLIWLQFNVTGKSTHGSTPDKGINAFRVGNVFLTDLLARFEKEFPNENGMFIPKMSTFEPTKCSSTVMNVNTIPGNFEFSLDIRALPEYKQDDILAVAKRVAKEHEKKTGAKIEIIELQRHTAGGASSTEGEVFEALMDSVESVIGIRPRPVGVGGATCANFFRKEGYDAYVWQNGGGTLHGPNEYVVIDNIVIDAKVFATLFFKLCV
ncbi:putative metallohydrolase [Candidatus Methanoplasma termitum]|uniref:Putative metallohydrolase n=1 Tax=Candidatus Methanoplasma termitum TaxID=1577791 RepID=A0A0A7LG79_9ARCH|nr:M20 family metallo-hydrolase [Candidatus Methanoplasma termitum]AIZ57312.1 putative metallohydrolase [Candidatus Methanoplasma termitum]MCL2333761.1 M20 family metallo-hydrolase [Candidatus Methanoplasma sp.]